jgi:hypothetical protein
VGHSEFKRGLFPSRRPPKPLETETPVTALSLRKADDAYCIYSKEQILQYRFLKLGGMAEILSSEYRWLHLRKDGLKISFLQQYMAAIEIQVRVLFVHRSYTCIQEKTTLSRILFYVSISFGYEQCSEWKFTSISIGLFLKRKTMICRQIMEEDKRI